MGHEDLLQTGGGQNDRHAEKPGISRRTFIKYCASLASLMALPPSAAYAMAEALSKAKRPSVIWLSFQECTGCTEALTRSHSPSIENLIFDLISLDYHHTLQAAAGEAAEHAREAAMKDAVRDPAELCRRLELPLKMVASARWASRDFSVFVPHGYLARMRRGDVHDPLLRQVLPLEAELDIRDGDSADPVGDRAAAFDFKPPFDLPPRFLERKAKLDLATPVNFVTTCDVVGGNSGSPVVNREGEIVGVIFDGNIESLTGAYVYEEERNRSVAVAGAYVLEALRKLYDAGSLADELERAAAARGAPAP